MRHFSKFLSLVLLIATNAAWADDWPQWLGPGRDGVWRETNIVRDFPDKGLQIRWRSPIGIGYAGPAVVGDHVYVLDYELSEGKIQNNPGNRVELKGSERVVCLDANNGKIIWQHAYARSYRLSYPSGPRCTPTVADGKVYALGAEGDLICLDADNGNKIWSRQLQDDFDTEAPIWGFAAHPLVDGKHLYCIVGGEGSVAVAFDKDTGEEIWRALSSISQGYCPPTMITHGGKKQLLIWHPMSINSLNPTSGEVHWSIPLQPSYEMSITAPQLYGDLLYASAIGHVGALFKLDRSGHGAEVIWRGQTKMGVYSCNTTPIIEDGVIYGVDCMKGAMMAVRLKDGHRLWETFQPTTGGERRASHGTAFMVRHENGYFLFAETGDLILARLSPDKYHEISRFHVLEPTNECFGRSVVWSHPAFANRCLYVRNDQEIVCVNLAAR